MTQSSRDGEQHHEAAQLERLTFFSDAVFAIAITLLVIEIRLPEIHFDERTLAQALVDLIPRYIGFVVSFFVVGRFWIAHHRMFGMLKATEPRLTWANLVLLMAIAFMPFTTAVISESAQLRVGIGFYAGWLTLIGLVNRWLIHVALGDRHLVRDGVDEVAIRAHVRDSAIPLIIGVTAFAAGMVAPVLAMAVLILGTPLIGWLVRLRKVG
jgi:uncharacterized membrane protein